MRVPIRTALMFVALLTATHVGAQQQQQQKMALAAELKGASITLAEVEKSAAGDLLYLEVQRERILQAQLDRLATAVVVKLEAHSRGLSETELIQQDVYSKAQEPSVAEIESYYQASKDLMKEPQERAVPRIREALTAQRRQKLYLDYIEGLKTKYQYKSLLEPVRVAVDASTSPGRGPATAPVTIVEFSDFECSYCLSLSKTLADLTHQYGDKVRLVYRNFPLDRIHPNAMKAAEVAACATEQDKFWEMHDQLFKGGALSEVEILKRAGDAGVKSDELNACLAAGRGTERVRADVKDGQALSISSTPSFFINGRPLRGAVPRDEILKVVDQELAAARAAKSSSAILR
jgi:protein-disulfide isomerase